jgi:hypothetical protein
MRPDTERQPYRRNGTPNASYFRRLAYANARTVGDLGPLRGVRRDDVFFDLARGAILVPPEKLPVGAFTASSRHRPSPTPPPSHPETATQEELRRLASLEDSNRDPDPKDVETACNDLRPEGQTPVRALAVRLLRHALDDEGATQLTPESLGESIWSTDYRRYDLPLHAAAFALHASGRAVATPRAPPPLSAKAAESHPNFEGADGWRAAIGREVNRVVNVFKALKIVPASEYHRARELYGPERVSVGHIVLAFRDKY